MYLKHLFVVKSLSCPTLCSLMDYSTPGSPVLHYLPEFVQIHVCWISDVANHLILCHYHLFSFCLRSFPASGSFPLHQFFASGGQRIGDSVSASILSMNILGEFPLWLTGLISLLSKGLSSVFFSTTIQKHQFFTTQSFFFFFSFIFISWRLITLQYCSGFCHTLTWISHGYTCIPHPDPPSHLPLHPIPLGLPSAPGPSTCLMHPTWAGDLFRPR